MARANRRTHSPVLKGKSTVVFIAECQMTTESITFLFLTDFSRIGYRHVLNVIVFLGIHTTRPVQRFERLYDKYVKKYKSKYLDRFGAHHA